MVGERSWYDSVRLLLAEGRAGAAQSIVRVVVDRDPRNPALTELEPLFTQRKLRFPVAGDLDRFLPKS